MNVYERLRKARIVGCPIVTFGTSDPGAASKKISHSVMGEKAASSAKAADRVLTVQWDCARGVTAVFEGKWPDQAGELASKMGGEEAVSLFELLLGLHSFNQKFVLIIHNAHRYIDGPEATMVVQAIWNLRDVFKRKGQLLCLMGPHISVPVELRHDVVELDEPLPTEQELTEVIKNLGSAAKIKLDEATLRDASRATTGLSAFAAEQLSALNISKADGLSVTGVWGDKCQKINETPGLNVVSDGSFNDLAGYESVKGFLSRILKGPKKPTGIVFIDEIEKSIGGASGDLSGTTQDQLGVLLQYMQDRRAAGCIFAGPPGSGKSAMAKRAGSEGEILTIQLDLGATKGSLVGQSESQVREALKVLDAVTGGNTLWLATANSIDAIPPELKRRFKYGTWYFDLPGLEEREAIWDLYANRYQVNKEWAEELVAKEWTGAEIESCCEIADRTGMTVLQAAEYIVPVAKTAARQIEALRDAADGRWLSANYSGTYSKNKVEHEAGVRSFDE